jgi:DNA polymerase III epsilon subunit-like protein
MDNHLIRFQKKKFLFLDFETFNVCLSDEFNLPWQVATILVETVEDNKGRIINRERGRQDLYLKWDTDLKISKEAKIITKYSDSKFKKRCIPEGEAFEIIYSLVEQADYLVGHNFLGFDIYLLRNWYRKHGKNYDNLPHKTLDTFAMAKSVALNHPYKNNECSLLEFQMKMIGIRKKGIKTSLGALGKSNQIEHDYSKLHDALVDLELNVKVWDKLKYQIDF